MADSTSSGFGVQLPYWRFVRGAHHGFSRLSSGGRGAALVVAQGASEVALDAIFVEDALVAVAEAVAVVVALEVAVVVGGGGGVLVPVEDGFGDAGHPVESRSAAGRAAMFTRSEVRTVAR